MHMKKFRLSGVPKLCTDAGAVLGQVEGVGVGCLTSHVLTSHVPLSHVLSHTRSIWGHCQQNSMEFQWEQLHGRFALMYWYTTHIQRIQCIVPCRVLTASPVLQSLNSLVSSSHDSCQFERKFEEFWFYTLSFWHKFAMIQGR